LGDQHMLWCQLDQQMQYLQHSNCWINTLYQYIQYSSCSIQNLNIWEKMHAFFWIPSNYIRGNLISLEEREYGIQASIEVCKNCLVLR
jgi:hypothetical protein